MSNFSFCFQLNQVLQEQAKENQNLQDALRAEKDLYIHLKQDMPIR